MIKTIIKKVVLGLVWFYQHILKRIINPFGYPTCRFTPSCSHYVKEAFSTLSPKRAFILSVKRVGSCHPGGGEGYDPVPKN